MNVVNKNAARLGSEGGESVNQHRKPYPATAVDASLSESALIGALLQEHDRVFPICQEAGITAASFTVERCARAWNTMAALRDGRRIVDLVTVSENYGGDSFGAMQELEPMLRDCATTAHAAYYVQEIRNAERRRGLHAAARMAVEALERGDQIGGIVADLRAAGEAVEFGEDGQINVESIADFLGTPPPPLDSIVEELFGVGEKGEIIAPSKARKSFFAIDLAVHIAAGRDWLGFKIPRPRRVLLFNLEISRDWMKRRFFRRLERSEITD